MLDIEPGQSKIVTLSIPSSLRDSGSFIFIPNANKLNYTIKNSLHEYNENNKFSTIIENNSNQKIRIGKKTKIEVIQKFHEEDIVEPTDQIGQVNTISLEKVKRMRKEELNPNQFNLNHLNGFSNPADFLTRVQEETHVNNLKIFSIPNGMNYDNIKSHQQNDKETKEIIDKINDNNNVTCKDYYMDNNSGLLMIKIKPKIKHLRNKHIDNKIVIRKSLVKTCLESAHGPHFGTTRTFHVVKKNYYWKNYFLDTKNFCENCHECKKNKSKPTNTQFEIISKSHLAPGQFLAIDIVGKLPPSYDGKFFILTIIDHYSRFLEDIPLPNITSSTIIKALNQYFVRFGIPKIIFTDNGTNLRSNEID
ncbi:hypothetical protein AVEN_232067-1 [Araneus ventricosus]|uniref:RNA-directed DNA polymerase n=1 Tax=Araneus ventricosus TaxID=182803 RepID=A0A4Y2MGY3_ARAVE|nr:hypothetical protein AVEN_232067-1 [Araneus ventricosus]